MFAKSPMVFLFGAVSALAACGGSTVTGPSQSYETLDSTAPVISPLVGLQRTYTDIAGTLPHGSEISGNLNHQTRSTTIGTMTDADGPDSNGALLDEVQTMTVITPPDFVTTTTVGGTLGDDGASGPYAFVTPFRTSSCSGFCLSQVGYIGVGTAAADIPSSGTATFQGEAYGIWPGTFDNAANVPTTVTADFLNNTVGISTSQTVSGVTTVIDVANATITGATFDGGTLAATANGTAIDLTSTQAAQASGHFYGYDTGANTPDEVGAMITSSGADGSVRLTILAD